MDNIKAYLVELEVSLSKSSLHWQWRHLPMDRSSLASPSNLDHLPSLMVL